MRDLAPSLRELFTRCGALYARYGGARLGGAAVARFDWQGVDVLGFGQSRAARPVRYRQIGIDIDENPLVVKPDEEPVYVVHRPESNPAKWWSSDYPSLYHWVLMQHFEA